MGVTETPDRNLALELVRVTEAAAMAAARWVGRGDKNGADAAAVNATFQMFVDRTLTVKVIDDATEAPIVGARIDARTG